MLHARVLLQSSPSPWPAAQPCPLRATPARLPLKYAGAADRAGDHAGDLMTRLYKYADDSMMGGTSGRRTT